MGLVTTSIRSPCHVDVVRALVAPAACGAAGRRVSIERSEPVTVAELAARHPELAGAQSRIVRRTYEEIDVRGFEDLQRRVSDCGRAERPLGFRSARDLDETIDAVVADRLTHRSAVA